MRKFFSLLMVLAVLIGLVPGCAFAAEDKPVLYNAIITMNYPKSTTTVYAEMDRLSKKVATYRAGKKLQVTAVYPGWVEIKLGSDLGYVLRNRIDQVVPLDVKNTPPYGVEVYTYMTVITQDTPVLYKPDPEAEILSMLTAGAKIALLGVENGYAKLVHKREYGYIDTRLLKEIVPIAPSVELGDKDTPISVFCSFYSDNPDRINNLEVACVRLMRTMQPGESLYFNESVGPFNKSTGYLPAPILVDGVTKQGYGGGSCQISSTLYNTVLQLPGITILERHPHGASGAAYLPHGVDASSGDLDFKMRNSYDFPIRIEASCHDLCLFMAIYRADV